MKLPNLKMNEKNPIIFQTTTEIPMSLLKQVNDNHMQKNQKQQQAAATTTTTTHHCQRRSSVPLRLQVAVDDLLGPLHRKTSGLKAGSGSEISPQQHKAAPPLWFYIFLTAVRFPRVPQW